MLLTNATYIDKYQKVSRGNILIIDGEIRIVDDTDIPLQVSCNLEIMDCKDYIVIPGLINGHYHNGSLLAKGLSKEISINQWEGASLQGKLQSTLFQYLDESLTENEYFTVCLKGYIDLIKNGVTFVSDSGVSDRSADYFVKAMNLLGIRGVIDVGENIGQYPDSANQDIQFTGHLPEEEDISRDVLEECRNIIEKYKPIMMTHCLENNWRKELVYNKYGKSTVELFDELKLLNEKTVLFHCVELSSNDIKIIGSRGGSIVHCPVSNIAGGGIANIKDCLSADINVCIGTDWARYDIWEAMRFAYFLLKINTERSAFRAEDVFRMATCNGAKAFGLQERLGTIQDGYSADLVFINKTDIRLSPLIDHAEFSNVVHNLIIECRQDMIEHVMIKGKWVMENRKILQVDEEKVSKDYEEIIKRIFGKYALEL